MLLITSIAVVWIVAFPSILFPGETDRPLVKNDVKDFRDLFHGIRDVIRHLVCGSAGLDCDTDWSIVGKSPSVRSCRTPIQVLLRRHYLDSDLCVADRADLLAVFRRRLMRTGRINEYEAPSAYLVHCGRLLRRNRDVRSPFLAFV